MIIEGLLFQHLPSTLPSPRLRLRRLRVCGATSPAELMAISLPNFAAAFDDGGASTRSDESLETIVHKGGFGLPRSASNSSLVSASADSQDQGPDGETEVVCEEEIEPPLEETAVRGATRQINSPSFAP